MQGHRPRIGPVRARLVHRVTAGDVGERVSLRYLVDDPDRGPRPTEIVGRLLSHDDEMLLVVDRDRQLHVIAAPAVLASRVVPSHPRLPPEPPVPTPDEPLERAAARILLLDGDDRVLLVAHNPASGERVWTAPGGGLRPGEDHVAAARRELTEELGVAVEPGPWVWSRRVTFPFRGVWLDQDERWFLATVEEVDAAAAPLDDPGTSEARWWSLPELEATEELLAPAALPAHLARLLADGPPTSPVDVGR